MRSSGLARQGVRLPGLAGRRADGIHVYPVEAPAKDLLSRPINFRFRAIFYSTVSCGGGAELGAASAAGGYRTKCAHSVALGICKTGTHIIWHSRFSSVVL
jgi:hypothetical protein